MSEPVVLFSRLPPEGCAYRLQRQVRRDERWWDVWFPLPWWWFRGAKEFVGYVGETSLRLRARVMFSHPFQTMCYGSIEPSGVGSKITCKFGLTPFGFVVCGVGLLLLVGSCVKMATDNQNPRNFDTAFTAVILLITFTIFRWLAKDEKSKLIEFLCRVLEAQPSETLPT